MKLRSFFQVLGVATVCVCGLVLSARAAAPTGEPQRLELWQGQAPLGNGQFEAAEVWLTIHRPPADQANGTAVVICPGGGYGGLVMEGEGHGIARWLNQSGITGAVLQYRLPKGNYHRPLLDVQRALRVVRARAAEWQINPQRIGVIGFSAGGHLASTAATHFDAGDPSAIDLVARASCRPDFQILVYPVISMGEQGHGGSRANLLGGSPSPVLIELFSNEKQVTAKTPPAFVTHAQTDAVVSVANSRMYCAALKASQVPVELQEFPEGNHGYNGYCGKEWDAWQKRSLEWLAERGFGKQKPAAGGSK